MDAQWERAGLDEASRKMLTRHVIALIARDRDQGIRLLGSAFVLKAEPPNALCVTAAHVIDVPGDGLPLTIRGVVSSDLSVPEAHQDGNVAGLGTAAMIWPALGFRVPSLQIRDRVVEDAALVDLLRNGQLVDASDELDRIRVVRTERGSRVRILRGSADGAS